jgi:AcrR family transcriptional regulator
MRDYDGKTTAERVAERRARLIDAGFELFGDVGYAGTSIRAVLRQSGLIDRYFAESFADLDALLAAVYEQLIDVELETCRAAIDATAGGSEGARAMIDCLTRLLQGNPGRARIKLREIMIGGPASMKERQKGLGKLAKLVAELFPPSPDVSARDRLLLAVSVVAAADELLRAWINRERRLSRQNVVDLVTMVFDSIAAQLSAGAMLH